MRYSRNILSLLTMLLFLLPTVARGEESINTSEIVIEHIKDSHIWHVTDIGDKSITIPLPIIVKSTTGWHVFSSNRFSHHADAEGLKAGPYNLYIATTGENAGKIIEKVGNEIKKPFDISITKTVATMWIDVLILLACILFSARWYKHRKAEDEAPKGFVGFIEMLVSYVIDNIIKPGVGEGYEKYVPYLLTCFFFIFTCNIMGLMPFPPGSGNVTGNIAITFFLALCTFIVTQFSGTKHYWKDIFWGDVPVWLKAPVPLIPLIEFIGIFTKPFALMIRLFANMMAGHAIAVALTCIIFLMAGKAMRIFAGMTALSIFMSIFMMLLEVLVCFIQAMVFTMLSSIFIGLARMEPEGEEK